MESDQTKIRISAISWPFLKPNPSNKKISNNGIKKIYLILIYEFLLCYDYFIKMFSVVFRKLALIIFFIIIFFVFFSRFEPLILHIPSIFAQCGGGGGDDDDLNDPNFPFGRTPPTPGQCADICKSWQSIIIESCTRDYYFDSPRNPICQVSTNNITLNLCSDPQPRVSFANVDPATNCYSVPGSYFTPFESYTKTKTWTLTPGIGEKKVCLRAKIGVSNVAKCGARIEVVPTLPATQTTPTSTPTPTPTPIPAPPNWYKVKNASLYKLNNLDVNVAPTIKAFDVDDTTGRYIMIGESGVGNIQGSYSIDQPSNPIPINNDNVYIANYSFSQPLITSFFDYIQAKKSYTTIASIGTNGKNIVNNKINIVNGPVNFDATSLEEAPNSFVLFVIGNVNINVDFNSSSVKKIAIIASGTITFAQNVTYANGIFIGNNITVNGSDEEMSDANGLKIKGNLISASAAILNRNRQDNSYPSLFVVFDIDQYLPLLSLLSTSKYDFQQLQ